MAVGLSTYLKNKILAATLRNVALQVTQGYVSLHSADPALTGANEIAGGSYARQAVTVDVESGGVTQNDGVITFTNLPAGTPLAIAFGIWDASTVGNFLYGGWLQPVPPLVDFFTGLASSDVITSYAHGLVDDDRVIVEPRDGAGLPAGLTEGTVYFVRDAATDTLKLALTSGGTAIDLTASGEGALVKVLPKNSNLGDTLQFADAQLSVRFP